MPPRTQRGRKPMDSGARGRARRPAVSESSRPAGPGIVSTNPGSWGWPDSKTPLFNGLLTLGRLGSDFSTLVSAESSTYNPSKK